MADEGLFAREQAVITSAERLLADDGFAAVDRKANNAEDRCG